MKVLVVGAVDPDILTGIRFLASEMGFSVANANATEEAITASNKLAQYQLAVFGHQMTAEEVYRYILGTRNTVPVIGISDRSDRRDALRAVGCVRAVGERGVVGAIEDLIEAAEAPKPMPAPAFETTDFGFSVAFRSRRAGEVNREQELLIGAR